MPRRETKIVISGKVGAGKTTIAKMLAKHLNIHFFSAGEYIRNCAEKQSLSVLELINKIESNPKIDLELHKYFSQYAFEHNTYVIDYRLGFLFQPRPFSIFLKVSNNVSANRLLNQSRANELNFYFNDPIAYVEKRNEKIKERFKEIFAIDFEDEIYYDLIIDTDEMNKEEIVDFVLKKYENYE